MMVTNKVGLSAFVLKWIAVITMLIDHTGMMLFPQELWLRCIGRMAFPIYCFLLVEGFFHTSDLRKYETRLFAFALLSEVPFDLARTGSILEYEHQNVFFTLFLGLILIDCISRIRVEWQRMLVAIAIAVIAYMMAVDYGIGGIAIILLFYLFQSRKVLNSIAFGAVNILVYGGLQNYAILSLVPINLYNGKKGPSMKYFFYFFYPIHLLILYWIKKYN